MKTKTFKHLSLLLTKVTNPAKMETLLKGLLTPTEIKTLLKRLQIVQKLKEGISHHKISQELGVGVATVTRGAKEFKLGRFKTLIDINKTNSNSK